MQEQLGTMINTQPAPQAMPDQNAASLAVPQPMHADKAAAALAYATSMSDHFLTDGQGIQEGDANSAPEDSNTPAEPQDAPGSQETPQGDKPESDMEARLLKQIDDLKEEIRNGRQDDKLDKIRDEVSSLAKDDGAELQ